MWHKKRTLQKVSSEPFPVSSATRRRLSSLPETMVVCMYGEETDTSGSVDRDSPTHPPPTHAQARNRQSARAHLELTSESRTTTWYPASNSSSTVCDPM